MDRDQLRNIQDQDQFKRNRRRHRRILLVLSVLIASVPAGLSLRETTEPRTEPLLNRSEPVNAALSNADEPGAEDRPATASGEIEVKEPFYDLMKRLGAEDAEILNMAQASRKAFDLHMIKAGQAYEIRFDADGSPARFEYEIDDQRLLILSRSSGEWSAEIETIEYQVWERVVKGVIKDSLYLSLMEACQTTALAINLADIFAWDIDFSLDLRPGDAYGILYQERWRGDRLIGPGRILAVQIINQGDTYSAVYYKDDSGEGDYYDSAGRSLQKQFLKSPLRFKHISSYFSKNRLHPVLKIQRPHLGVDYAAPYGTPVRTAADGRVVYKGRDGHMGNMIKIRHNGIYSTAYGHLSRYAKGLGVGRSVKQGEIIGYVGSTGLSTGPHLHYSFYKHGKLINPLREKNPRAKSIPSSEHPKFEASTRRFLERAQPSENEKITAAIDRPGA